MKRILQKFSIAFFKRKVANTNFKNVEFLTHVYELVRFLSKTDLTKDH